MADMKLDKKTFRILIIVMLVLIVLSISGVLFFGLGGTDVVKNLFNSSKSTSGNTSDGDNVQVTDEYVEETYTWEFNKQSHTVYFGYYMSEYDQLNYDVGGLDIPQDIPNYIDTGIYDGRVSELADTLFMQASSENMTDEETMNFILSFVRSLSYKTDAESNHSEEYPRTPLVTLADKCGDSLDLCILAYTLLKNTGFASAIYFYPAAYENKRYIPEAAAFGRIGNNFNAVPVFAVYADETADSNQFNSCVSVDEDGKFFVPVEVTWLVDTAKKETPQEVYFALTPVIINDESLFYAKSGVPEEPVNLNLETVFDLTLNAEKPAVSTTNTGGNYWKRGNPIKIVQSVSKMNTDVSYNTWRKETISSMDNDWYNAGIVFNASSEEHWGLHELFLSFAEVQGNLYTPQGNAVFETENNWRMTYSVTSLNNPMELDTDSDFLTPYADFCIAVYRIPENDIPELIEITGWQGHSDGNKFGISNTYPQGKYAVGIFTRNVSASVNIEYYGKPARVNSMGSI